MIRIKKSKTPASRIADFFNLPAEVLAGMPKITLTGDNRLHIENHRGLIEYSSNLIAISAGRLMLTVKGGGLELVSMNSEQLLITGKITGIDLE